MIDQQAYREKYDTLEKIFKDPYDAKVIMWIARIGIPMALIEIATILSSALKSEIPFWHIMSSGELYVRGSIVAFGVWSSYVLIRMRSTRRRYGKDNELLETELRKYGEPVELRSTINRELAASGAVFLDGCAITDNWIIKHPSLGNRAMISPLKEIRFVGKILDYKHPALIFQDANSKELGKASMDFKLIDELADRLKR